MQLDTLKQTIEYKKNYGKDDIYHKEIIKQRLINNSHIIDVLKGKDDLSTVPSSFINKYIYPYYLVPDVQVRVNNYICFETNFTEVFKYNNAIKLGQITFYVLCHVDSVYMDDLGVCKHDLLASLIIDEFNYSNLFGKQVRIVSDRAGAVDNKFILRTLVFEQETQDFITKNGKVINKIGNNFAN